MKILNVFLLFFLIIVSINSQEYFPFPSSGAIWNHNIVNSENAPYISYRYRLGIIGDTIINSKEYSKVYQLDGLELDILEAEYVGAIREENKKIYAITLYNGEPELLLYDFDVEIGDIINSNSIEGYISEPLEVLDIEEIELLDGTIRKKLNVGADYWIEGIGGLAGLFAPITAMPLNWTSQWLKCFHHNEIDVYIDDYTSSLDCEFCFCALDIPSFELSNIIQVYPNPFTNEFHLNVETNGDFDIKIYNSEGVIVTHFENFSSDVINFEKFSSGIYLILLLDNNRLYSKKIMKK